MSSQNVATTLVYMAYNTSTGAYVTGDVANHTLKLVKDGTEASPTNSPAEVDATNTPGAYKLALTAAETQFGTVWLGGKSSTANVIIVPITLTFEILPTALDANSFVKADVEDWKGATAPANTGDAFARLGAPAGASVSADIAAVKSDLDGGVNMTKIGGQAVALDANNLLKVDVEDINGSATGGVNLGKTTQAIGRGTCAAGGSTTSITTSAFAPGGAGIVSGQFIGRTVLFDANTATSALQGQASNITANTSGATPTFTVAAMTTAPSSGDTFSIV